MDWLNYHNNQWSWQFLTKLVWSNFVTSCLPERLYKLPTGGAVYNISWDFYLQQYHKITGIMGKNYIIQTATDPNGYFWAGMMKIQLCNWWSNLFQSSHKLLIWSLKFKLLAFWIYLFDQIWSKCIIRIQLFLEEGCFNSNFQNPSEKSLFICFLIL